MECVQIYLAPQDLGQLGLHGKEVQPWNMIGVKLYQDVDVAIGPKILAQNGTKEGQATDMMVTTEINNLVVGNGQRQLFVRILFHLRHL
jgi:hypothetical protein